MDNHDHSYDDEAPYQDAEELQEQLEARLGAIVGKFEKIAQEQVTKKVDIENRWIKNLQQFHGKYDQDTITNIAKNKGSQIFVNMTRAKTNTMEARLSDMLFPTDDKNWGIKPTPNPELADQVKEGSKDAKTIFDEAEKRSEKMGRTIEDQLREANYNIKSRDVIQDACRLGTGVMKGPTVSSKSTRHWEEVETTDQDGNIVKAQQLVYREDPRPMMERVDPWNYFPDMNARNKDESEFDFERHLMNKKELRKLAKQPGFDKDAIRDVLRESPKDSLPTYITQLKSINEGGISLEARYQVWEYHGPLEDEDLKDICACLQDESMLEEGEDDPLQELQVIMWFCGGKLLKFGISPLDSGDSLYSVFNLEKDESSIFGFGVPYMMSDSQRSLNAGWRMIMDNSALSTGPQIVVDKSLIEPADGNWTLTSRKVWHKKAKSGTTVDHAFKLYNIDSRQNELERIIDISKKFIDIETNLPEIAQGEQGAHTTQTMGGMSMLMNSVNVVFRRIVKNFDDDMTTPNITRLYDWNMQFNEDEAIKGDYNVDARGSSVLLVREVQAQNLMAMAMQFSNHPVLGPLTKAADLYRLIVQAHMLPADSIVKTEDDIKKEEEERAKQPPQPDPVTMKIQADLELAKMNNEFKASLAAQEMALKRELADTAHETAMMTLAAKQHISMEDIKTKLALAQNSTDSKERLFEAEVGVKAEMGSGI